MKTYTAHDWYDVRGRGRAASVTVETNELPTVGELVEIDKQLFTVSGVEKIGINLESWKGQAIGLLVTPT